MITEYHRPKNLQEALDLLSRKDVTIVPLGGGTILSRFSEGPVEVVDLQSLKLDQIGKKCEFLSIGATATLQSLIDSSDLPGCIKESLLFEGTHNIRQVATVGGTLISAKGDSLFSGMLLACNTIMLWEPESKEISYEKWMMDGKSQANSKLLIEIHFPFESEMKYEKVGLTPGSKPELFIVKSVQKKVDRYVLGGKCQTLRVVENGILNNLQKLNDFLEIAYSDFSQSKMTKAYFSSTIQTLLKRLGWK